jgi:acyl-homoserine lactone acylase PvdQ
MTNAIRGPVRTGHLVARLAVCLALLGATAVPGHGAVPAKGTEILWDRYGIPHITASDSSSLFYAYGYAQMEAHAELLLRLYTQARGRGAEFYEESYLPADRWVRTNGIPARARAWANAQSPEFAPLLRAFVDGLNAWASEHSNALSASARAALPVSIEDVHAHCLRVIHYDWIINARKLETRLNRRATEVLRAAKLSTHVETADQFADDLVATARKLGTDRVRQAADVLEKWDREAEAMSDGTLLFYRFLQQAGTNFQSIGGYAVPLDERNPLNTPRGFADPAKAVAALDAAAGQIESAYASLHVLWGDVLRFRHDAVDLPGNGAPSTMGAIRTINPGPFVNGKAQAVSGDTYFAVIEFSNPVRAEALLSYGNWSKAGSAHVEDQMRLLSRKEMRPVWRTRQEIEDNLENRKVF